MDAGKKKEWVKNKDRQRKGREKGKDGEMVRRVTGKVGSGDKWMPKLEG